jgi:hypothetical protein
MPLDQCRLKDGERCAYFAVRLPGGFRVYKKEALRLRFLGRKRALPCVAARDGYPKDQKEKAD